jgi:MerR family mercuric resistance operon transcriptional regulator
MRANNISIGKLSKRSGVHIETIRYYERIGVMPRPPRTEGGHRVYDEDKIKRLFFIKRSRELGFSIKEITALFDLVDSGNYTCAEIHERTTMKLLSVQQKVADLCRLERVLKNMVSECSRGDLPDCPILDTLFDSAFVK